MIKHTYIHIPFCHSICSYCSFCKILYNHKYVKLYLEALKNELNHIYQGEIQETIYIGGGTPSVLDVNELEQLFKILSKLKKDTFTEYTIECNFSSLNLEKLLLFKKYGINRLSFGIESISDKNLKLLEREEQKNQIVELIKLARKLGFNNINLDLMYAIPKETMSNLDEDLEFIMNLNPEHISTYSCMIEPNTKLYLNKVKAIDEDLDFKMYQKICNKLKKKYIHYEISNFAKEQYQSKHNLGYWKNEEYYGFGVSASSYRNNSRYTNTKSITKYIKGEYDYYHELLDKSDKMSYEMILGLRLLEGVSKKNFFNKFQQDIKDSFDIDSLLEKKLLNESKTHYYINEKDLYISNSILVEFIKE